MRTTSVSLGKRYKKVLIACEFSGAVRDAFLDRGHDVISCDLLDSETPGPHYKGDVRDLLDQEWDMMIAFPPCTDLAKSGARWWPEKQKDGRQQAAVDFFMMLYNAPVPLICVENPSGYMSTAFRKPDQNIEPWQYGHPYTKRTDLWLKGLPMLEPDNVVEPEGPWVHGGSFYKDGSRRPDSHTSRGGGNRAAHRHSVTFPGVADAMARQWGYL